MRDHAHDKATVEAFFDALGEKRTKQLKLVSCDMAGWIEAVLAKRCPKAKRCVDPFHVVQLATEALDKVRREVWNEARRQGQGDVAAELKGTRYALWKNPENLTARQQSKLADVEKLNRPLYRAYLLLCRHRHNSSYADLRVMPTSALKPALQAEIALMMSA